jgi:hypothetical protein
MLPMPINMLNREPVGTETLALEPKLDCGYDQIQAQPVLDEEISMVQFVQYIAPI